MQEGKLLMEEVISDFEGRLATLRTGRANASILYGVNVEYYGTPTPLDQIAQISVVEGTQIAIKPFDPSILKEIEREINESHLNLLAQNDGTNVRINVPALTEETRRAESKNVGVFAEEAKVQIRNIRRDLNDDVKETEGLPEDQEKKMLEDIQTLTNEFIKKIDDISKAKVDEIMTV
ncbi:ribosome recycling factor [Erysipelothrix urinaevulpis]|uniref:ribosome recycling factor n=1 Tax=Erysipelothrix urinaevulpis TaxID=2683717 RepID=UPI00135B6205|nr:ribosome recycling factor [Erysipelothrix urinaevulpis]